MSSVELRAAKEGLIKAVNSFITDFKQAGTLINSINATLESSQDTVLRNEMLNNSKSIVESINSSVTKIQSELSAATAVMELEIKRLETRELITTKKIYAKSENENIEIPF